MEYISEYDYAEIKTFTLEQLNKYLNIIEINRTNCINNIETMNTNEKEAVLEIIKEYYPIIDEQSAEKWIQEA